MKKSELRKLVSEYNLLTSQLEKPHLSHHSGLLEKLAMVKHRYFHETGNHIESDLKSNADDVT